MAIFEFPSNRKKQKTKEDKTSRLYCNLIDLAQELQRCLENADCSPLVDLARKLGVSRVRVTQILRLLSLAPQVLKDNKVLRDPLP